MVKNIVYQKTDISDNDVISMKCKMCKKKDAENKTLKQKIFTLENTKDKKVKKELTDEEIAMRDLKKEENRKKKEMKESEYKKAVEENKKLKDELLQKFGVKYN